MDALRNRYRAPRSKGSRGAAVGQPDVLPGGPGNTSGNTSLLLGKTASYINRHHLALFALFIALGGTSFAAGDLPFSLAVFC